MIKPMVSVLMTVYNDADQVALAVRSILNQSFTDFEFIIVNDGSTDNTNSILKDLASMDKRIQVYSIANSGTAKAANYGLTFCNGKYIARLDSDDISYPHRLQTEVDFLERNTGIDLVGGGCHIADLNGTIIGVRNIYTKNPHKTLLRRCIYQKSDIMFRKSVLAKLPEGEVYRSKLKAEDYDLWLRISEVGRIAKINEILGVWRLNRGGYTLSRKEEQLEAVMVLKKMAALRRKGLSDGYEEFVPVAKHKLHRSLIREAEYDLVVSQVLIKEGRTLEAKKLLRPYKKSSQDWQLVKRWYQLAGIPVPLLKLVFSFREFILNNSSIELR